MKIPPVDSNLYWIAAWQNHCLPAMFTCCLLFSLSLVSFCLPHTGYCLLVFVLSFMTFSIIEQQSDILPGSPQQLLIMSAIRSKSAHGKPDSVSLAFFSRLFCSLAVISITSFMSV
jgi:hypothetical protein